MASVFLLPTLFGIAIFGAWISTGVRVAAGASGLIVIAAWIRFPWVGLWWDGQRVVGFRSWWRPIRKFQVDEIARFRAVDYMGPIFLTWPAGGRLQSGQLSVELVDGASVTMWGTITSYSVARDQARKLNSWLGIELPRMRGR